MNTNSLLTGDSDKLSVRNIKSNYILLFILFPVINILIHMLLPEYGLHGDELYYVSIGDSFSFKNFDFLPLSPLYLRLFTLTFGHSIKIIHLAASAATSVSIILAMLIAIELGGKKYSLILTGILLQFSLLIAFGSLFTYDCLDFVIQLSFILTLVKIIKYKKEKLWIAAGIIAGFGFLNKMNILFFLLTFFISVIFTPLRKYILKKYFLSFVFIIILFTIPFICWQTLNGWYFLDFARGYTGSNKLYTSVFDSIINLIYPFNILYFPIWFTGFILILFSESYREFRVLGFMFIVYLFIFLFIGAQFYFLIPLEITFLVTGLVWLERFLEKYKTKSLKIIKFSIPAFLVLFSLWSIPNDSSCITC